MNSVDRDCTLSRGQAFASLQRGQLSVGNAQITRSYAYEGGGLRAQSLTAGDGLLQWVAGPPALDATELWPCSAHRYQADLGSLELVEEAALAAGDATPLCVRVRQPTGCWNLRLTLWPDLPVILQSVALAGDAFGAADAVPEFIDHGGRLYRPEPDRMDCLPLAEPQLNWQAVTLYGRSDHRDNLVETRAGVAFGKQTTRLRGHLLHLTRWDGSAGLAAMKLAPAPDEQLGDHTCDFALSGGVLSICGSGITRSDLAHGPVRSYTTAVGLTDGKADSAADLMREVIRRTAPPRLPEGGVVFVNNWGGGGGTSVVNASFVKQQIDAAARLKINHVVIDAGWHRGDARALRVEQRNPGSTSAQGGDFWAVDPERFPAGLQPIADHARQNKVALGLWYCLNTADDYANWPRDRDTLLKLWREHNITHFKIDGLSLTTRRAEANVFQLFTEVDQQSGGAVSLSVDITGSKSLRPGLLHGLPHVRSHFVENRYTRNATYWPHRTLRNLWQLARYVPSYRLEFEWMDTMTNAESYGDHPLSPAAFGTEYALATTLAALPLAWMHAHQLPARDARRVRRVLEAYRPIQRDLLTGAVDPIGEAPSGTAWTGFLTRHDDGHGYLLLFRERNDRPDAKLRLSGLDPGAALRLRRIAGAGRQRRVKLTRDGTVRFRLAQPQSYALYRWEVAG